MAKISKRLDKFLVELQEGIQAVALTRARIKADCPHLPGHFADRNADWYAGLLQGKIATIESLLMTHGIYNGFNEFTVVDKQTNIKYTYPHYFRTTK